MKYLEMFLLVKTCCGRNINLFIGVSILSLLSFWIIMIGDRLFFDKEIQYGKRSHLQILGSFNERAPVFITDICNRDKVKKNNSLEIGIKRQMEQAITMIKSAAIMTKSYINFIILVDNDSLYNRIVKLVKQWPKDILNKFSLQKREVWYPEGRMMKDVFRACSTGRLFIPERMTDIDAVVYVDTDALFLRPPEELWDEFQYFNSVQMSGMVDLDFLYKPPLKLPYYGSGGLNSKIWMMNLTRMRNYPGGWENACHATYEKYKEHIYIADQDIANKIFNKTPEYLYDLSCRWNFRSNICQNGVNICEDSKITGVFILHGCEMMFYRNADMKMKTMYNVWKNFEPGRPLTDLLASFKKELKNVDKIILPNNCSRVKDIDRDFTKGLENNILNLNGEFTLN